MAAGQVAQVVTRHMDLFYAAKPVRARAAICWNVLSSVMWVCMRQPQHYIPSRSTIGAYWALYQEHVPADFIHVDQIASGKLEDYDLLYLPFSFMISRAAAARIEEFVRRGGVVLAEARTAWNDETGTCGEAVPGLGLEQVFGCRERGAEGVSEDVAVPIHVTRDHAALPLLKKGDVLAGARFREELEVLSETAQVVGEFENGSPAIVVNRYGQGWAIFIGTMLSLGFFKFHDGNAGRLLKGLARLAGIEPPVQVEGVPGGLDYGSPYPRETKPPPTWWLPSRWRAAIRMATWYWVSPWSQERSGWSRSAGKIFFAALRMTMLSFIPSRVIIPVP